MLSFIRSQDSQTIAFKITETVTKEDLLQLKEAVEEQFPKDQQFNALAIVEQAKMPTAGALLEEAKIDIKHWSQYNKLAVISEKSFLETMTDLANFLPGIQARHFFMDEIELAWSWVKE
ncbi:alanine-alpha-ketoisovalerate/valine-pyruvate aminotransferase [Planomicrobium stackebrandtii]|uniref:Alanine-alpha-ketoisovalerate/valine-pyruvate aminotransferase n=1 Tax=Planomicrobium stackebrandtii TaxID=253160 RepID=A0ABU0GZC8_9BACL|nr:STAS/SEC14 domain-containing protein [Planomicrobium stackebrandtii]MDQ0430712.1 alanine-alpha-ketoisovalerate/valine-pyruvate aminotransferase [Planomicrobium stackebrandtii]